MSRNLFAMLPAGAIASAVLAATALAQSPSPSVDLLSTPAEFAYIMDGNTGQPLYSKRGDDPTIPASMTKIMTLYIVFERLRDGRLKLDDEFVVSETAWRRGGAGTDGSTMFLKLNSKVSIENLLRGVIIQSGNDACIVLAEGISGSEEAFARMMTERAHELGMTSVNFVNATGLEAEGHQVSPHDLARMAYLIIHDFPQYYPMFSEDTFTWNGITQPNRNPLLKEVEGADGLKTGHLEVSGYGLVGSAVQGDQRRIIVLNGLKSMAERASEARRVMRAAFNDFKSIKIVAAGAEVGRAKVWLGEAEDVALVASEAVELGLHVDAAKKLKAIVVYEGPLRAPIKKGDKVGRLVISAPGLADREIPLTAGADVRKLNLLGRALAGIGG